MGMEWFVYRNECRKESWPFHHFTISCPCRFTSIKTSTYLGIKQPFMDRIFRRSQGPEGSGLGTSGFRLFFLQMTWSCWPPLAKTYSMDCGGSQSSVKQLG
ncbi:hypothetical protein AMECASPLE_003794 [Ameca splendens]|uniref:Uncharacterized protein n=1 Tax=Ameca splendens TaxID=208324 RepID=A0ABV0YAE4_9TELE